MAEGPEFMATLLEETGLTYEQAIRRGLATLGKPRKTAEEAIADGDYESLDDIAITGAIMYPEWGKYENGICLDPFDTAQILQIQERKSVGLFQEGDRKTLRNIYVKIEASGDFSITGRDCGENPTSSVDSGGELSLIVPAEEKPRILGMLKSEMVRLNATLDEVDSVILDNTDVFLLVALKKLLDKNEAAVSILRDLLEEHDIPCRMGNGAMSNYVNTAYEMALEWEKNVLWMRANIGFMVSEDQDMQMEGINTERVQRLLNDFRTLQDKYTADETAIFTISRKIDSIPTEERESYKELLHDRLEELKWIFQDWFQTLDSEIQESPETPDDNATMLLMCCGMEMLKAHTAYRDAIGVFQKYLNVKRPGDLPIRDHKRGDSSLPKSIYDVILDLSNYQNTMTEVRLVLSGAVMDRKLLDGFGMRTVCTYSGCEVMERHLGEPSGQAGDGSIMLRVWLSRNMHLREARIYRTDGAEFRVGVENAGVVSQLLEGLTQCVSKPPADRAEDEWELLTHGYNLTQDNPDYEEAFRRGLLLDGLIKGVFCNDKALAARAIMGAVRFPDYCPNTEALASIANEAAKIGMCRETALVIKSILQRDAVEPVVLNFIGCAMHFMGQRDCALLCFLQALEGSPSNSEFSNNVWLEAREVFPFMLREGRHEVLFALAQRVVSAGFTGTDSDKAQVLCSLGMAYEAQGDHEEAVLYYTQARQTLDSYKPAIASSYRLGWSDGEIRRAAFERLVRSFPQLPEECENADSLPVKFTDGDTHGSHWATVTTDVEGFIAKNIPEIIAQGTVHELVRPTPVSMSQSDSMAAVIIEHGDGGHINEVCINILDEKSENKQFILASAYPVGAMGPVNELAINRFLEWPGSIEGQIECVTRSGRTVTFFDPYYMEERQKITAPCVCEFELCGFAQKIGPAENHEFEITDGPLVDMERERVRKEEPGRDPDEIQSVTIRVASELSYLIPTEKYPDECQFRGVIEDVEWFDYYGLNMCRLCVDFNASDDHMDKISVSLYAGQHVLGGYTPVLGDSVEGVLWLQGRLHSDRIGAPTERRRATPDWGQYLDFSADALWRGITNISDFQRRALAAVCPNLAQCDLVLSVEPVLDALACDPEIILRLSDGRILYLHVRGYASDEQEHETVTKNWKDLRLAYAGQNNLHPCWFVEVCFQDTGKGFGLSYTGLDELKKELCTTTDSQRNSGETHELNWVRAKSDD
ncbi:MAG: tetratricopeptide repeat protein [Candidatus Hydrogenedentes bacterium]|nr:tetratricopeptide repeat protein [Candidatus Hydrogenedentota bacterium]